MYFKKPELFKIHTNDIFYFTKKIHSALRPSRLFKIFNNIHYTQILLEKTPEKHNAKKATSYQKRRPLRLTATSDQSKRSHVVENTPKHLAKMATSLRAAETPHALGLHIYHNILPLAFENMAKTSCKNGYISKSRRDAICSNATIFKANYTRFWKQYAITTNKWLHL